MAKTAKQLPISNVPLSYSKNPWVLCPVKLQFLTFLPIEE